MPRFGHCDRDSAVPAELFTTLIAYAGTYRLEGDKWTTKVEVAWIPEWVGTEQVLNNLRTV
jgi:hypothetical protein